MKKNKTAKLRKPEILAHYYQVIVEEGFEGASIGKVAKRMKIHPSLIIHYFKTKANMTLELIDLIVEKYEAPAFFELGHIQDHAERFEAMIDTIFSLDWSRTLDPGLHFGFYYLSFRNPKIRRRYEEMIGRFRDYLANELAFYRSKGIVAVNDVKAAADHIVVLMEGLEFHAQFLSENKPFEHFAQQSKKLALGLLKGAC